MDFFEAQAIAKRRTMRLVVLFAAAVLGTIAFGYAAAITLVNQARGADEYRRYWRGDDFLPRRAQWWDLEVFLWVAGSTLVVVGTAALYKWHTLRRGGSAIAEMVGGRPVEPQTTDLAEKRLLNIVEEMSIASGVPMPAVYVLDQEPGLNAFAAGLTQHDAAIAVTRGTLEKLSRDELQGVVAHEFSHVLNGDMRLNVRITGIVFGILVIGLIGRSILRGLARGRVRSGGGKNKGGGVLAIVAIGLALMIIGYVGYFFGRLIQAAVSRQREFLADAAAVQFTRNPTGISGALKKIGGFVLGGNLIDRHAAEIGHFFFAQAFKSNFGGLWATHPPLAERIRAVEPSWDGRYHEPPATVDITRESFQTAGHQRGARATADEAVQRAFAAEPDLPPTLPVRSIPFAATAVIAAVGSLTESHMRHARKLLDSIPVRLREAAREPSEATALVYGLLLQGTETGARERQLALITRHAGVEAAASLAGLRATLSVLEPAARLPLLQLCEPALRRLDHASLDRFLTTLDELVHADAKVSPYEYALQKMVAHHLQLASGAAPAGGARPTSTDVALVLACLARLGTRPEAEVAKSFEAGGKRLRDGERLSLPAATACTLSALDDALERLVHASLPEKQELLAAAAEVIGHDGTVTVEEADLFRAIAATLDCPVPPLAGAS